MNNNQRVLLFLLLPLLAPLLYPPETLEGSLPLILVAVLLFLGLGILLWRGYRLALVLSIFIQGLNVIVRLMMFFPHAKSSIGEYDIPYIVTSLLSMALSWYLLMRLDSTEVRVEMVR